MQTIPHMHDFISDLPVAIQEKFNEISVLRSYPKGYLLYSQGDVPEAMYQLVSGEVQLCNYSVSGREFNPGQFRAGDCFGEMGLIDGQPRVSHAIVSVDAVLRVLSLSDFGVLKRECPEFTERMLLIMCHRLRYLYLMTAETSGLANMNERLALNLYRLAFSRGEFDEHGERYIRLSQEQLATLLSTSRQTINKELQALVTAGFIELKYGKIYFSDLDGLRRQYHYLMGAEQVTPLYAPA